MSASDTVFTGSIPAIYDTYLGPLIFRPYALDTAHRVAALTAGLHAGHILEVAAGTGVATRELAAALPPSVRMTVTDLNGAMLEQAKSVTALQRIDWQVADGQALSFADAAFDVVVCQFGVMFFPDRVKAYREARRVLKPGGAYVFNAWDTLEHNDITRVVVDALARMFPDDPPNFMTRTPHGYADLSRIRADVAAAGFGSIEIETVTKRSIAPDANGPAIGFTQGTPLRNEIEARDASRLAEATERVREAVEAHFGTGPIDAKIQAIVVTARD